MATAGVIGIMTVAAGTDHKGKGFFVFKGGWEYVAVVGAAAAALTALGPGPLSIDGIHARSNGGIRSAVFSVILGVFSALGVLATVRVGDHPEQASSP